MLRKTMLALAFLALLGLAAAQITVTPTLSTGDDEIAKGADEAAVGQTVVLELPEATALHLTASTIEFDLNYLDGVDWEARARGDATLPAGGYACVYVSGDDATFGGGDDLWGQGQTVPGGIGYLPTSWDTIKLVYFGNGIANETEVPEDERVVTYPPIRIRDDGTLDPGSKDYFVCYQTFVIQLFSNWENFSLQVSRTDMTDQGIEHLYVQGNTCAEFGTGTGLYALPNSTTDPAAYISLLPKSLTEGPTGSRTGDGCNPNSSWMDVLGVLAVKVNADLYGTSTADLTYTLISQDTQF